jgi:hypothetical protein
MATILLVGSFAARDAIRRSDVHARGHGVGRCDRHKPDSSHRYGEEPSTEIMEGVYEA